MKKLNEEEIQDLKKQEMNHSNKASSPQTQNTAGSLKAVEPSQRTMLNQMSTQSSASSVKLVSNTPVAQADSLPSPDASSDEQASRKKP